MKDKLLIQLHKRMESLILRAGISEKRYKRILEHVEDYTEEQLTIVCTWLNNLFETLFLQTEKVWVRHPPERWDYYIKILKTYDLTEQKLLNRYLNQIRQYWRTYPYAQLKLKKKKRPKQKAIKSDSDGVAIRSENTWTDSNNS